MNGRRPQTTRSVREWYRWGNTHVDHSNHRSRNSIGGGALHPAWLAAVLFLALSSLASDCGGGFTVKLEYAGGSGLRGEMTFDGEELGTIANGEKVTIEDVEKGDHELFVRHISSHGDVISTNDGDVYIEHSCTVHILFGAYDDLGCWE